MSEAANTEVATRRHRCTHEQSRWGRCAACGMAAWQEQAAARTDPHRSHRNALANCLGEWHGCLEELGSVPLACATCELVADTLAVVYADLGDAT